MQNKFLDIRWDNFGGSFFLTVWIIIVMGLVPILFHLLSREVAGLLASSLFLFTAGVSMHGAQVGERHQPLLVSSLVFLFAFAVPILVLRLAFWGVPFNEIQLGVISGKALHSTSSWVYVAMLLASIHRTWGLYKLKKP